jgi:hypothetical protein
MTRVTGLLRTAHSHPRKVAMSGAKGFAVAAESR